MGRRGAAVSAGSLVVVGAAASALINQLDGGWVWWLLTALVVLIWAAGTAWHYLADRPAGDVRVGSGGVYGGRDIKGCVRTRVRGPDARPAGLRAGGTTVGAGGVFAQRDITGPVDTEVNFEQPSSPTAGGPSTGGPSTGGPGAERTSGP